MGRLLFALLVGTAAFAQAAVLPALGVGQVRPDLTLTLLLVWSAARGVGEGILWVFGLGLLLDLLALDPLGTNGLALLPVALLGGPARRRLFQSGLVFPILLAVVATVMHGLALALLRAALGAGAEPVGATLRVVALQALFNAVLVPPCYLVAGWLDRRVPSAGY